MGRFSWGWEGRGWKYLESPSPKGYVITMNDDRLVAVVETLAYLRHSAGLLTEDERGAIIDHLAANPTDGDIMPGGGGLRKLRWGIAGRGKRGGVRLIHYFADRDSPVVLLDIFAKNEKANYSASELAVMRQLVKRLVDGYRVRRVK
jgi:hypothetical protein